MQTNLKRRFKITCTMCRRVQSRVEIFIVARANCGKRKKNFNVKSGSKNKKHQPAGKMENFNCSEHLRRSLCTTRFINVKRLFCNKNIIMFGNNNTGRVHVPGEIRIRRKK